jgi:RND family efflux transporter MFP subunit
VASLRIDRSRPRDRGGRAWLLLLILLAVVIAIAAWWWLRPDGREVRLVAVREQVGEAKDVGASVLNASGYVVARRRATVSSKITGKVVEVLFDEGLTVRQGQVLARLDDVEFRAALALAESRVLAAEQTMRETESLIELAEITDRRARELLEAGVGSQEAVDEASTNLESLRRRHASQAGQTEVVRRELQLRRVELDNTVIRSPFDGVVISKDAQPGEMVSPVSAGGGFTRTGICTVVDMSSLEVEVEVNESYISRVEPDQRVEATLDAYPDWVIPGSVITTIPAADRQKATVLVRIAFDALDPRILPDMGVKVAFLETEDESEIPTETARRLLIPVEAVIRDQGQDVVFVYDRGRVERRAVRLRTARRGAQSVEVEAGLSAGERIVLEPPQDLKDRDAVSPVEP